MGKNIGELTNTFKMIIEIFIILNIILSLTKIKYLCNKKAFLRKLNCDFFINFG